MTSFDRRSILQQGAALLAATALGPAPAFAQAAGINFWHTFTSQSEFAGLEAILSPFKASHPGIAVTQESIPNSELMAKMTAAFLAKSLPSSTLVTPERFGDLQAMGALVDLTDRIAKWNRRADFDNSRFDSITKNNKVYGVPAFSFVDWMYYRKDWFDEAGLKPPTTLDEFRTAAIKLTNPAKGRYGFSMRAGAGGHAYVVNVMEAFGAKLSKDGKGKVDRAKAIAAVTWWANLFLKDRVVPPSAPNDGFRQIMEAFQTGQTAMMWHHTGSLQDISAKLKPGVEFATVAIPAGPVARVARLGYAYCCVTRPEVVNAAWEWVKFWGEPDSAVAFLEKTGYFPASNAAAKDKRVAGNPLYKPAVDTLGFGVPYVSFPGYAGWSEGVVLPAFQRVLIGSATPDQAVDEMIDGLSRAVL